MKRIRWNEFEIENLVECRRRQNTKDTQHTHKKTLHNRVGCNLMFYCMFDQIDTESSHIVSKIESKNYSKAAEQNG